jgi:16S rRNA (guanine966-N2)-methyltransferase
VWADVTCLDLFAGTGALGLEAASRGAQQVTMIESNSAAVRQLSINKEKLHANQVSIMHGDALSVAQRLSMGTNRANFKLIFLDPPYHQNWLARMLPVCTELLAENGLVYAESEIPLTSDAAQEWMNDWDVVRADKAGMVFYHLLKRKK